MSSEPKLGTYGALTRSTEEEFKEFRHQLNSLLITPEQLVNLIIKMIESNKK